MDITHSLAPQRPHGAPTPFEKPNKSRYLEKLKEARKERGQAKSSDEESSDEELDQGTVVLHKLFDRRVTLHPGNVVIKSGKRIRLEEAEALRIAEQAQLPVPHVHNAENTPDGKRHIKMDYIEGQALQELWPHMSADDKKNIAQQLRALLKTLRAIPPPPNLIGGCDGIEIRDTRLYSTHHAPACINEDGFNAYLLSSLFESIPPPIRNALARRLRTDHRIVLSHCDLSPRNIIVKEGKIMGLIDWEDAGWYPEYWEYVKFFQRSGLSEGDWRSYADDIFPQSYPDELVDYIAISKWQSP